MFIFFFFGGWEGESKFSLDRHVSPYGGNQLGQEFRLMGGGALTSTLGNHPLSIFGVFLIKNSLTPLLHIENGCDIITMVPNCAGATAGRKSSLPFAKHWQKMKIFNRDLG